MPKDEGEVEAGTPSERPTLIPDFDFAAYAKGQGPAPPSPAAMPKKVETGPRRRSDPYFIVRQLISRDDYAAALTHAEAIRRERPADAEADYYVEDCRHALVEEYERRLGSLEQVPLRLMRSHDIKTLAIDPQTAFILGNIDGVSTLEMILDVSGMPRLEALRLIMRMLDEELIELC